MAVTLSQVRAFARKKRIKLIVRRVQFTSNDAPNYLRKLTAYEAEVRNRNHIIGNDSPRATSSRGKMPSMSSIKRLGGRKLRF